MRKYKMQIEPEEMQEYGEFFRSMRKSIGYTLAEMAQELGVFRTTLSKWEKGITIPNHNIDDLEQQIRGIVKTRKK